MKRIRVALAVCLPLLLAACNGSPQAVAEPAAPEGFHIARAEWEQRRREELLQPDGWTSLIGLHWLQLKAHFIGAGEKNGIRIAIGPDQLGKVEQRDGRVFFTPEKGVAVTVDGVPLKGTAELKNDRSKDGPSVLGYDEGRGRITVIERGGRQALRVKHAEAPGRVHFAGLEYWTADPAWRIEGRFVAHPPGRTIPVADIIGVINETPNPGAVEFEKDGRRFRLEALAYADDALFFVFADRTSGHGSYPAGRFLDTALPDAAGKLVLDFNRAYNPPCAFTPFATCPLPPPENRLDLAVTAGEKQYVPPPDAALPD